MKKIAWIILIVLIISACSKQPSAEETAQKLTILLNDHNYGEVYQMIIPDYKLQVSEENFVTAMEDTQEGLTYIYEKTVVAGDSANAVIDFGAGILDKRLPIALRKTEEGWKVDAFGGVIKSSCRAQNKECVSSGTCTGIFHTKIGLHCGKSLDCCERQVCITSLDCKGDYLIDYICNNNRCELYLSETKKSILNAISDGNWNSYSDILGKEIIITFLDYKEQIFELNQMGAVSVSINMVKITEAGSKLLLDSSL